MTKTTKPIQPQNITLCLEALLPYHYNDVTMSAIASQITNLTIVYSTVYSDQRKQQSSASLAFARGIHRDPAQMASYAESVSIWWRHHAKYNSVSLMGFHPDKYLPITLPNGHPELIANSLRPRPNRRHFADDILKCIFLNENEWHSIKISLKFVPKVPINNVPALVQIMAWHRTGDKPLSEPMMVSLVTHICVTRPQ